MLLRQNISLITTETVPNCGHSDHMHNLKTSQKYLFAEIPPRPRIYTSYSASFAPDLKQYYCGFQFLELQQYGGFPHIRVVIRSFGNSFVVILNKLLNKQWIGYWIPTPLTPFTNMDLYSIGPASIRYHYPSKSFGWNYWSIPKL